MESKTVNPGTTIRKARKITHGTTSGKRGT